MSSPVSVTPAMHALPVSLTPLMHQSDLWQFANAFNGTISKKQAISRYYFLIASIQSSKESSIYNKIVCFAGFIDTGEAREKSNISAKIRKKSKSFLGLSTGTRRSCLKKKTRGEKSGGTVPLSHSSQRFLYRAELILAMLFSTWSR
jgi:hypothetical protein